MRHRKAGTIFMTLGVLLLVAALSLTVYNIWDDHRAGKAAEDIMENWSNEAQGDTAETDERTPDYILDPEMEMPVKEIDGVSCIGTIEIPSLGVYLPVISEWSYPDLRIAPCRYAGSAYSDDLVIAAHNYRRHFGMINTLEIGSEVILTDAANHSFHYTVSSVELLNPVDVEEMTSGGWDLTLFTCTTSGRTRYTVRCTKTDSRV